MLKAFLLLGNRHKNDLKIWVDNPEDRNLWTMNDFELLGRLNRLLRFLRKHEEEWREFN